MLFDMIVETVTIGVILALVGIALLFLSKLTYSSVNLNSSFQLFIFLLIAGMLMSIGSQIGGLDKKFCSSR